MKHNGRQTDIFGSAFNGIICCFKEEKNCKIHLFFTVAALSANVILQVSPTEWCLVLFAIGSVWAAEIMNTAVERTIDLITTDFHPLAKKGKDMAAGSVLILSAVSVLIGLIIYLPKFIKLVHFMVQSFR